jgi:hypothetical protein
MTARVKRQAQVGGHVIGRHHPARPEVVQAGVQVAQQVVIRQHLDRLAQPLDLSGRHDVGDVTPVRQHRHGLPALRASHGLLPRRGLFPDRVQVVGRHADRLLAHVTRIRSASGSAGQLDRR